jgi:hypothetical protein
MRLDSERGAEHLSAQPPTWCQWLIEERIVAAQPDEEYERESDRVAVEVMRMKVPPERLAIGNQLSAAGSHPAARRVPGMPATLARGGRKSRCKTSRFCECGLRGLTLTLWLC